VNKEQHMETPQFELDFFPAVQYKKYSFAEGVIRETSDFLEIPPEEVLARFKQGFKEQGDELPEKPSPAEAEQYYRVSQNELIRQMWAVGWEKHRRAAIDDIVKYCPLGGRALDYGGGVGWDSIILRRHGLDMSFMELDGILSRFAAFRFASREMKIPVYHPGSLPQTCFDLAFAHAVLEHLPNPLHGLAMIHKSLKRDGLLLLVNGFDDSKTKLHLGASFGPTLHTEAEKLGYRVEFRDEKNGRMRLRKL